MILDWKEYEATAVKAVEEGIVLLENRNGALPLSENSPVAIYGRIQLHYYKSGTGSGGMVNVSKVTDITLGLLESGKVKVNQELLEVYKKWEEENPFDSGTGWGTEPFSQKEMPVSRELAEKTARVSPVAIVVIGRSAGEDKDNQNIPGAYLLSQGELEILKLIAKRLLTAVSAPCRYAETTAEIFCGGIAFKAKGKTVLSAGWKGMEEKCGLKKKKEKENDLPPLQENATLPLLSAEIKDGKTAPPKHFTEDTLLQNMETAGADEMPDGAERRGLGTPATRAGIIEKLVQKGFLERRGDKKTRYLIPTQKGTSLVIILPEQIQSPSMTAEWEEKLLLIERGDYSAETFMEEICAMVRELTETYEVVKGADVLMQNNVVIGSCPHCGAEVVERRKGWFCSNRECRFTLWADNAFFNKIGKHMTKQIAEKLVRDRRVKLKDCKSQKTGKTYNATVLLEMENDGKPRFKMEFENGKESKR